MRFIATSVLIGVIVFGFCGCGSKDGDGGGAEVPGEFSVFYTCDTRGHIEPCGCSSGMAGGISRRHTYIMGHLPKDYLLVDAGDVTAGNREWELLELEYILKGYEAMGHNAVNVGHREVSINIEDMKKLTANYGKFVSVNVVGTDGEEIFKPYVIVNFSNDSRCGIMGAVDDEVEADLVGKGVKLLPAAEAIGKHLDELKKKSDYIVLLAFMSEQKMKEIAERFFEIDMIVGGKVAQSSGEPIKANKSVIVYTTDKGKAIGRLDVSTGIDGVKVYKNDFTKLVESMERADASKAIVDAYKLALKERDFQPHKDDEEGLSSITALRSKNANKYIGSDKCKKCHEKAYEIWKESKHSHAFASLEEKDDHYNPKCLKCHTIGYMASDGYINQKLTPKLKDVGCENCHGRGDYHAKLQSGEELDVKKVIMKTVKCTTCHDEDNSPEFEQEKYWEIIAHGKEE